MKCVRFKPIVLASLAIILFVLFLFAGFLIPALLCLDGYFFIDRRCLRCPHCAGFTNLANLWYARKHPFRCPHCGEVIQIEQK